MQPVHSVWSKSRSMHQLRGIVRGAALLLAAGPALVVNFADPVGAQSVDGEILSRETVTLESNAPEWAVKNSEGVRVERIVYASDGFEVEGYLVQPADASAEPLPCVIYCRGGNRNFGALNAVRAAGMLGRIAQRGYIVVASQYRGNGEFGTQRYPGERVCEGCGQLIGGEGREEFGGVEIHDVLAMIPLLEALPEADASRLGIFGWSRGGMMTYLALQHSDRFEAAIVGAGEADAVAGHEQRPDMAEHVYAELIPGWEDEAQQHAALEARSAVLWADQLPETTPILLLHGTSDWRVDPTQALDMARALLEAKRPYRLVMMEGGDHGLSEHRAEVNRLVDHWLDTYVRDGAEWPSLEPHGR